MNLDLLTCSEKQEALELLEQSALYRAQNKIDSYSPYPKQIEFHSAGLNYRQRLLRAGNQNGKTFAGAAEMAFHLTGLYPDWWKGRRWDRPVMAWAGSDTGETTRDNPQRALFGIVGEIGTGSIPAKLIDHAQPARGVSGLLDYAKIKHVSGGVSTIRLKYYEQGRQKWQGPPVDALWLDEESPPDIYSEAMARTIATGGMIYTTFTPLLGMTDVVRGFLMSPNEDQCDINMTIEDALHIPAEERERIIASFPAHERKARARGIPILGSGLIFPVDEDHIKIDPFPIPKHFAQIAGIDFGWDHPSAGARIAWDRDQDIIYLTHAHRAREQTPLLFAGAVRHWGNDIPWAWPHDGLQHDKGSGEQLAEQYRGQGLNMLWERATFSDGSNGVEAGIMEILDRMQTGRFKVFSNIHEFFEEMRLYHRKDGRIVKEGDDLISATRYAIMMKRFAMVTQDRVTPVHSGGWMG
jgi:phage terminase large subunit-like protein